MTAVVFEKPAFTFSGDHNETVFVADCGSAPAAKYWCQQMPVIAGYRVEREYSRLTFPTNPTDDFEVIQYLEGLGFSVLDEEDPDSEDPDSED